MKVPPEHSTGGGSGDPADSGEVADPGDYDFGGAELPEPDYSDCDNIWEELELLYEEAQAEIQAEADAARAELAEGDEARAEAIDAAEEEALAELEAQLEERVDQATEACGPPR
jgi:hypothetical protein